MVASPPPKSMAAEPSVLRWPQWQLTGLLNRFQPAPETIVLLLSVAIGSSTGLAVILFHWGITWTQTLTLEGLMGWIGGWGAWTLAFIPCLGGLIVGVMRWIWKDFGPSLSALISAPVGSQKVEPPRFVAKAIAAAISLGTGASLGPEGPSVELGGNIGVLLGQALQVSQDRQRLLVGAGAAAGLAAGFNAPIAGVFFALEVVLGTSFATSAVSVVLLAAVVAALISQIGLGGQPAFILPSYDVRSPLELPLYLGLGLFASLVSIAYTQAIRLAQQGLQGELPGLAGMRKIPIVLRPALGGLLVGLVALQFPHILGIGYETVEAMLQDVHFSLLLLLSLLVAKLVMTAVSLGSGLVGGLFAPAMFLGASLGSAYGKVLPSLLPLFANDIAAPPAYAMVGMAAVLAASVRAPLTAILLLFEMTRDYRIILPLMASVGLSVWLVERLKPITRTVPATQSTGLNVPPPKNVEVLQQLLVGQAMHHDFLTLPSSLSVVEAGLALTRHQTRSAMVVDDAEALVGIVTLQDINRTISIWEQTDVVPVNGHAWGLMHQTLVDICTAEVLFAYEDETIADAMTRMATRDLRQLPVVDREQPSRVIGVLEQTNIELISSLAVTLATLVPYQTLLTSAEPVTHAPASVKQAAG